jgi:hypothetical protein
MDRFIDGAPASDDAGRTGRTAHRRATLVVLIAFAFAAACSSNGTDVSTNTTVGPAATSAPGTTQADDDDTDDPGTTTKRSGTTSTTSKGRGTSTTTKRETTTTKKSTGTTVDVDTPPEAEAFCAKAKEIDELFEDEPETEADRDAFVKEAADAFAELTPLAPDEIADDMNKINDAFQSASSFDDLMKAFEGGDLDEATDHIDEYMDANCGFNL